MIDMRYKPYFLPQVSAPYEVVIDKLQQDDIDSELVEVDPNELNPMQGIVFSDEVGEFDQEEMDPIWISKDNDIIDGHHRFLKALMAKAPLQCIRLSMNGKDGARALNKVQDIYDYEQQQLKEVEVQDAINVHNETNPEENFNDLLEMIGTIEAPKGDGCKVIAYREKPILENSAIGNFFILSPVQGYDKYEIDFENLLDTNELGIEFGDQQPIDALAKSWFPNVDFDNLSAPYIHSPQDLKNKAIADRAQQMGYDGIKYGNHMVQGFK
jgi:hypothetical protein